VFFVLTAPSSSVGKLVDSRFLPGGEFWAWLKAKCLARDEGCVGVVWHRFSIRPSLFYYSRSHTDRPTTAAETSPKSFSALLKNGHDREVHPYNRPNSSIVLACEAGTLFYYFHLLFKQGRRL